MTAVVGCIYANGMIQLLEKYPSKSTNAFLAVGDGNGRRDGVAWSVCATEMARCLGEGVLDDWE